MHGHPNNKLFFSQKEILISDLIICTVIAILTFAVSASTVFLSLRVSNICIFWKEECTIANYNIVSAPLVTLYLLFFGCTVIILHD